VKETEEEVLGLDARVCVALVGGTAQVQRLASL
jgi:hypothetical protein